MAESMQLLLPLLTQERAADYRICCGAHNYLLKPEEPDDGRSSSLECDRINDTWRLKMTDWAYDVVDQFSVDREAVAVALNYVDRFMVFHCENNEATLVTKRIFQLLTLTSLYLAIKLHGSISYHKNGARTKPTLQVFVEMSENRFTTAVIEQMEFQLLTKLKWRLNPPLSVNFVYYLLDLLPNWVTTDGVHGSYRRMRSAIYEVSRYMTETSICVSDFTFLFMPSAIGFAAILAALDALEQDPALSNIFPPSEVLLDFFQNVFDATSLRPTVEDIKKARSMLVDICPAVFSAHHVYSRSPATVTIHSDTQCSSSSTPCTGECGEETGSEEAASSPTCTEIVHDLEEHFIHPLGEARPR